MVAWAGRGESLLEKAGKGEKGGVFREGGEKGGGKADSYEDTLQVERMKEREVRELCMEGRGKVRKFLGKMERREGS